ncbi:hypothetical protein FWH30_00495, partial [Microgenomates group bacterium]|nr:hypothetical protein [Microgenomates group bacterium]
LLFHTLPTLGIFICAVFVLIFHQLYLSFKSPSFKHHSLLIPPLVTSLFLLLFPFSPPLLLLFVFFSSFALSFQKKDSLSFSSLPTPAIFTIFLASFALLSYLLFSLNQVIKVLRLQQKSEGLSADLSQVSSSENDYLLVFNSLNTKHLLALQSSSIFPQSSPLARLASQEAAKLALYQNYLDSKHFIVSSQITADLDELIIDSLSSAENTLALNPHDAQNWYHLALINHQFYPLTQNAQFYQQAVTAYQQAILLDPFLIDAYLHLGSLYLETYDYLQAAAIYTHALTLDQSSALIYYHLARAYYELYDLEKAYDAYQYAFNNLDKNDPFYQQNVSLIQAEIQQLGYTP